LSNLEAKHSPHSCLPTWPSPGLSRKFEIQLVNCRFFGLHCNYLTSKMSWDEAKVDQPSKLLKYNVHTPLQSLPTEKVQQLSAATALPCALLLHNVHGDINIGMAIRTAAILGCSDVHIVGRRKYDRRSEVGARNYIGVHLHSAIDRSFFEQHHLVPIVLEQGGTCLEDMSFHSYLPRQLPAGHKVVFVLGSESEGVAPALMADCRALGAPIVSISQYGPMRSFNVSIAASIVLYEYTKQWRASVAI
jgi:tRNA G18 (ribose-2'-O)-methylase SpoU